MQSAVKNKKAFKKILIANRSEIALRIQATCRSMGIKTVAIYAPEDAQASYVQCADEAYPLTLRGFQAYLNQEEIISLALQAGVDAIHPGYGFLSESPAFVEKVLDSGMAWIGPQAETMMLLGDKAQARSLMRIINVPMVQGHEFRPVVFDISMAREAALALGYPVIIKDSLGGGGKAMRRVERESDFDNAWHAVLSEGKRLGFLGNIIVEKYLSDARHIEVQIAGDGKNFIHLFERECSIQRKHQKIIEEAPCRFVAPEVLDKLYAAAVAIARAVNYCSIGTVEFLVDATGQFYFLEVNARLQVEHSVTEMTTGVDLVELQVTLAEKGHLPWTQEDIKRNGHAIECRVYAEDPSNNFMPCVGVIEHLRVPRSPFIRVDHDLAEGHEVTPFFDPMIAKISAFGATRDRALGHMATALKNFDLGGCGTNIRFLLAVIENENFCVGLFSTHWLTRILAAGPRAWESESLVAYKNAEEDAVLASILHQELQSRKQIEQLRNVPANGMTGSSAWRTKLWK